LTTVVSPMPSQFRMRSSRLSFLSEYGERSTPTSCLTRPQCHQCQATTHSGHPHPTFAQQTVVSRGLGTDGGLPRLSTTSKDY
jgi:hypothetical protein